MPTCSCSLNTLHLCEPICVCRLDGYQSTPFNWSPCLDNQENLHSSKCCHASEDNLSAADEVTETSCIVNHAHKHSDGLSHNLSLLHG